MDECEVLRTAAGIIVRDGWRQGLPKSLNSVSDSVCVGVAIHRAAKELLVGDESRVKAERRLFSYLGVYGMFGVVHWNDDPHTTVEDVLLALKTCAEEAA